MLINEVFPKPTVKQVIFQIRFPNLFYMEDRIGDLQMHIMEKFTESSLLFRKRVLFADIGPEIKQEDMPKLDEQVGPKIWQFSSPLGYKLNVLSDRLDITSEFHKTYDNKSSDNRFRDIIEFVLDKFFVVTGLPVIHRIGLRYIDECPLPSKDTATYKEYFSTAFNLEKFSMDDATEMDFKTVIQRGRYSLRYVESLQRLNVGGYVVILDFDAFARDINPNNCLEITDDLHDLIIAEYSNTIKEPIIKYMKGEESTENAS